MANVGFTLNYDFTRRSKPKSYEATYRNMLDKTNSLIHIHKECNWMEFGISNTYPVAMLELLMDWPMSNPLREVIELRNSRFCTFIDGLMYPERGTIPMRISTIVFKSRGSGSSYQGPGFYKNRPDFSKRI